MNLYGSYAYIMFMTYIYREAWSSVFFAASSYLLFGLVIKQLSTINDNYTLQQSGK